MKVKSKDNKLMDIITPTPSQWDAFVSQHPRAHVLQLSAWGEHKRQFGWGVDRIALSKGNVIVAGAQILLRRLPFYLGTMGYIPFGPYVTEDSQWSILWRVIQERLVSAYRTAFLKIEPGIYHADERIPSFEHWGLRPSSQTVQPPRTILIDIRAQDDELLARMNQGTRRKIRQSLKNGIHYYQGGRDDVEIFAHMMQATSERNAFGIHEPDYYKLAYELFAPQHAALILAEHEGDPLAGIMVFGVGNTAQYLYGASSNIKRNLMAAYGVQWHAIQWAKARGYHYYDMWGIPDEAEDVLEAQFQTRSDGLWGVYGFKRGWGGQVVRSMGAYDLPYNRWLYYGYQLAVRPKR